MKRRTSSTRDSGKKGCSRPRCWGGMGKVAPLKAGSTLPLAGTRAQTMIETPRSKAHILGPLFLLLSGLAVGGSEVCVPVGKVRNCCACQSLS